MTAVLLAGSVSGCGTFVPGFGELYDTQPPASLVDAIISHVHCEVKSQVEFIILDDYDLKDTINPVTGKPRGRHLGWLDDYAAQATLTLTVEDKTTLSPGVTLNTVRPNAINAFPNGNVTTPQSFNLGLGVGGSADATGKSVVSWYIDFREFTKHPDKLKAARRERDRLYRAARESGTGKGKVPSICTDQNGVLIEGDLKFREWLYMALRSAFVEGGVVGDYAKALADEARTSKKTSCNTKSPSSFSTMPV